MSALPMEVLKAETLDLHRATERTALAKAMGAGMMTRAEYKLQLLAYRRIFGALESAFERCTRPCVRAVWRDDLRKVPLLVGDLETLGPVTVTESVEMSSAVEARCAEIASADGAGLLGALYVFEGSTLGAQTLHPRLADGLELPAESLRFYQGYGRETLRRWRAFSDRMNVALAPADRLASAVLAARATFMGLGAVFDGIRSA